MNLLDSLGAAHTAPTGTCTAAGANTNASGQCTITFTSNSTGKVTGHASSTLSVTGSAAFTVQTDGQSPNSGDAVKTFVNARISIAPNATNEVGAPHTFTVTSRRTSVTVPASSGRGGARRLHVDGLERCNPVRRDRARAGANTNASGQCTITFTSNTAGKVTGHASSSTRSVVRRRSRATDGRPNSADAVKTL